MDSCPTCRSSRWSYEVKGLKTCAFCGWQEAIGPDSAPPPEKKTPKPPAEKPKSKKRGPVSRLRRGGSR